MERKSSQLLHFPAIEMLKISTDVDQLQVGEKRTVSLDKQVKQVIWHQCPLALSSQYQHLDKK
jgi:hypothetical protein